MAFRTSRSVSILCLRSSRAIRSANVSARSSRLFLSVAGSRRRARGKNMRSGSETFLITCDCARTTAGRPRNSLRTCLFRLRRCRSSGRSSTSEETILARAAPARNTRSAAAYDFHLREGFRHFKVEGPYWTDSGSLERGNGCLAHVDEPVSTVFSSPARANLRKKENDNERTD